jgi:hypothetical protein
MEEEEEKLGREKRIDRQCRDVSLSRRPLQVNGDRGVGIKCEPGFGLVVCPVIQLGDAVEESSHANDAFDGRDGDTYQQEVTTLEIRSTFREVRNRYVVVQLASSPN